jgi:hypothetical protein
MARGNSDGVRGGRSVETDEAGARGGGPENPAGRRDVPATRVMIGGNGIAEPAFDLHTEHEGMEELRA